MIAVFCDFNGTIVERDTLAALLAFAGIDDPAKSHPTAPLRERIALQAAQLHYSFGDAIALLNRNVAFDSRFLRFSQTCARRGAELLVLSSGLEPIVRELLRLHGCGDVPVAANDARFLSTGWRVNFRDASDSGNAKERYVERAANDGKSCVVVGDDESDFAAAVAANRRFARRGSPLAVHLRYRGVRCEEFDDFDDVRKRLFESGAA